MERNKQLNIGSSIIFLIRCRKAGITPNFIKNCTKNIQNIFHSNEGTSEQILKTLNSHINNFHNKILNTLIKHKHEIRKKNTENVEVLRTIVSDKLTAEEAAQWINSENIINKKTQVELREKHKKKFNTLKEQLTTKLDIKSNPGWFCNKTKVKIPEQVQWLLSHGKKFALPHEQGDLPLLKYITDGEECIKTINGKEDQEMTRNKFTSILESHMNKHSLTNRDRYTLQAIGETRKFLTENNNIVILEADKGNVTVAMERTEYEKKMSTIVNDMMMYKRINKDPTTILQKKNNELVEKLYTTNIISEFEKKRMKTEVALAPRIYGLPKIHKDNYPLRPICSSIGSPSSELCKYISNILKMLNENSTYNVKNSKDFKEKISSHIIEEDEIMVSFDVVSLFPSIPVDLAIQIIEEKWNKLQEFTNIDKELFFKILRFCIQDSRYFIYKEKIYQQKKGLPMGSSASPIVADIVMEELLNVCIESCDIRPKILTKYVDDLFGICQISAVETILTKLNSFNPNIKFTMEKETNCKLAYLDTVVIRTDNKNIILDWYQKPTSSGRLVNFHSQHPRRIIINTASNFIERVINISHHSFHKKNYKKIREILYQNSFPKQSVEKLINRVKQNIRVEKSTAIFKSVIYVPGLSERFEKANCIDNINYKIAHKTNNTLQTLFTKLKSKIDTKDKSNLVYQIVCKGNENTPCGKYYIGTTKNKLKTRLAGHKSDLKSRNNNSQKTALTSHCAREQHQADLDNVCVLQSESNYSKRMTLEMLHIINTTTTKRINYKTDVDGLSQSYRFLIRKKKREK